MGAFAGLSHGATTWYVSQNGNDASPGTSWAQAKQTLQSAINASRDGDSVVVSNGVYLLTNSVAITNAIYLTSANGSALTTLDGQHTVRCLTLDGAAVVDGFTLQNGRAITGGGAYCNGGTIQDCLVVSNQALGDDMNSGGGGGVYLAYGLLSNCVVVANSAVSTNAYQTAWAGGVYCYGGSVQGCVVSNNLCSADTANGGGVVLVGGQLRNSQISLNRGVALTAAAGGGVYATIMQLSVSSVIDACVIANNSLTATDTWTYTAASAHGAGLNIGNGTVVRSCLIVRNSAQALAGFTSGGGIWTSGSDIENCTVAYNNCTTQNGNPGGGGGVTWGYSDQGDNNIIRFNSADNGPDNWEVNQLSYPVLVTSDLGSFVPATNLVKCLTADPLFVNPAANDYRLQPGSACLNAGTNLAWMTTALDLAGNSRTSGGAVDLGAYQHIVATVQPTFSALVRPSSGQCQFTLNTVPGETYHLQYSATLTNWISLLVTNASGNSLQLTDPSATNGVRFYRFQVGP